MHGFNSWSEVLEYARSGAPLYYHAPLNVRPVRLGGVIRRTSDPFTADKGHLDRFLRPSESARRTTGRKRKRRTSGKKR